MAKWASLADVAGLVHNGQMVALGGMTMYRRPIAFVRALLQRPEPPRALTLLCFTAGLEADLLIGAGCVRAIRSCYVGLESFGFAPMFTEAAQKGQLEVIEETEMSLASGLRAAMAKIGFMPGRGWLGTDLPRLRPDVCTIVDPYTGETLMAFPAITPDVAVIHALEADAVGNFTINKNIGVDEELINTAKTVIVTVERQVEQFDSNLPTLYFPAAVCDYLALAPKGAYPTSCYPFYPLGGQLLLDYVDAAQGGVFQTFLERFKTMVNEVEEAR